MPLMCNWKKKWVHNTRNLTQITPEILQKVFTLDWAGKVSEHSRHADTQYYMPRLHQWSPKLKDKKGEGVGGVHNCNVWLIKAPQDTDGSEETNSLI